ncbi:ATP-binding protein [Candidatus Binatia bacterium]|nr:ATP-binding protein [Candidatus Binatia bacterium]
MVERRGFLDRLAAAVRRAPVTALLGPRQCGKTTLASAFCEGRTATRFDLESEPDLRRLQNPEMVLGALEGLVVLDEIQVRPELFGVLRVLVDRPKSRSRFLILGSAAPTIVRRASESLAGRVELVELGGFDLGETGAAALDTLWLRGGFPRAFLASSDDDSLAWRDGFIRTFLERDIPQLGITIAAAAMRRFWTMLAHYHGQTLNASELARSMSLSDKTIRAYLDILTGTFMVRQLQPWFENVGKRQVKAPKVYLRDSGLLHALLGLGDRDALLAHPRVGASWEGFAVEQVVRAIEPPEAYFWATHGGAELDLLFVHRGCRYGVEVKFSEAPVLTASMRIALHDLRLEHLWVVYPGTSRHTIDARVTAWPLREVTALPSQLPRR